MNATITGRWLRLVACGLCAWAFAAYAVTALEARSSDGRYLLRADNERRELIVIDPSGRQVARIAVADRRGVSSRVARILDAPPRASFIVLLADIPEAWELPYDPRAAPVFDGLVHDYRMGEGIASRTALPVRRIVLDAPITEALFTPSFDHLIGAAGGQLQIVNLHVRHRIETVDSGGDPRPAQGAVWRRERMLIPDYALPRLLVLDTRSWTLRPAVTLPAIASAVRVNGDAIEITTDSGQVRLRGSDLRLD